MFRELDSTAFCILLRTSLDRAQKISYRHLAPWTTFPPPSPQNVDGYYLVSSHARLSNHGQLISTANTLIAVWSTNRVSILLARSKVCSACTGTSQYAWASCDSQNGLGSNREYQVGTEVESLRSLSISNYSTFSAALCLSMHLVCPSDRHPDKTWARLSGVTAHFAHGVSLV